MHGFRDLYESDSFLNYHTDTRVFIETEYPYEDADYILTRRKERVESKKENNERVVLIHRNTDAYQYYKAEYRENSLSEDGYGNLLVPIIYRK